MYIFKHAGLLYIPQVPVRDHMLAGLSSKVISMGRSQNDMETAKWCAIR